MIYTPPEGTEAVEKAFIAALLAYVPPKPKKVRRKSRWKFMIPAERYYARQRWLRRQAMLRAVKER